MKQINHKNILIICFLVIIFIVAHSYPAHKITAQTEDATEVNLDYFYYNPCGSCDVEKEFYDTLIKLLGEEKTGINLKINNYNTFTSKGEEEAKSFFERYNIPADEQGFPIVYIGDKYLIGKDAINREIKNEIINLHKEKVANETRGKTSIIYFYANGCKECEIAKKYIDTLSDTYTIEYGSTYAESEVSIEQLDMGNMDNLEILRKYTIEHNVPQSQQVVPIIFIGEEYLSGADEIKEKLEIYIKEGRGFEYNGEHNEVEEIPDIGISGYTIMGVLLTGFVNGLNPCSISMLLFLISILLTKKVNVMKLGFSFILGKFVTYILLGTIFYKLLMDLNINWINTFTKWILLAIFFTLFLYNLLDYFAAKNENYNKIKLQLPKILRKYNHSFIKKVDKIQNIYSLMAFCVVLGALISFGEFLCTGQIYLATIVYFLKSTSAFNLISVIYFVLYGVAFVIPLVIITVVVHRCKELFSVSEVIRAKMHHVKFINMILFLVFFIAVFIWF